MKNNLKASLGIIVGIFIIFTFSVTAYANDSHYDIDRLYMSLDIPEGMVVTKENVSEPSQKSTDNNLVQDNDNIYLSAASQDGKYDISITMTQDDESKSVFNYKYLSANEIYRIVEQTAQTYGKESSYIEQDRDIFITYYATADLQGKKADTLNAQTIINGQRISLVLTSYDGEIPIKAKGDFNSIINSIEFTKLLNMPVKINLSEILSVTLWVLVVAAVLICAVLAIYYKRNANPSAGLFEMSVSSGKRKEIANKYYDELKDDGCWNETMQFDKIKKQASAPKADANKDIAPNGIEFVTYHKGVKTVVATVDKWKQMSLSGDEWEEKNQEDLSGDSVENKIQSEPLNDGNGPLLNAPEEKISGAGVRNNESGVELSRSNNDDFDEYEDGNREKLADEKKEKVHFVNPAKAYAKAFMGKFKNKDEITDSSIKYTEDKKKAEIKRPVAKTEPAFAGNKISQQRLVKADEHIVTKDKTQGKQAIKEKLVNKAVNTAAADKKISTGISEVKEKIRSKSNENISDKQQRKAPAKRTTKRREAPNAVKRDKIVGEFEADSYWDKYR